MGVDAEFKARPFVPMTGEHFDNVRARLHEAFPDDLATDTYRFPDMQWDEFEIEPTIEVLCTDRYYGPGHERGYWPHIKRLGDWLAVELGELAEVRYGRDDSEEWECLQQWGRVRDSLQRHWDEHGNEPYDRRRPG